VQPDVAVAAVAPDPLCTSAPGRPTFHPCGELLAGTQHTTHANDINAIFWYKGLYHAMFQERKPYPCADWAHLVSTNLATWKRLPDALVPTKHSFDGGGVLDGSLSMLPGLPPVILYDAHGPERGRDCPVGHAPRANATVAARGGVGDPPTIGIAHPKNASDPELREWSKSHTLIKFPRGRYSGPTRIWYNALLKNYNLLMINGASANSVYSTTDSSFATWTGGGSFTPASVQGGCGRSFARIPGTDPPMFMVQSNVSADPNDGANAGGWYAVGHYNLSSNRFTPTVSGAAPQPVDFGTLFCNELGADDPAQGRLLFLGNIAARDNNHTLATVVRSISFDASLQRLLANPVAELAVLRRATLLSRSLTIGSAGKREALELRGAPAFDLELNITLPKRGDVSFSVTVLDFGVATPFSRGGVTLKLSASKASSASSVLMQIGTTDRTTGRWVDGALNYSFPLKAGERTSPLHLRLLVDHLSVEAFAVGGRGVASTMVDYNVSLPFPPTPPTAYFSGTAGTRVVMTAWAMGCGWESVD
jgi:sucrose-6-phosphate hydrolase SacC (GH32 family)